MVADLTDQVKSQQERQLTFVEYQVDTILLQPLYYVRCAYLKEQILDHLVAGAGERLPIVSFSGSS